MAPDPVSVNSYISGFCQRADCECKTVLNVKYITINNENKKLLKNTQKSLRRVTFGPRILYNRFIRKSPEGGRQV